MGIRLGIKMGYSLIDPEKIKILENLIKEKGVECFSELDIDEGFLKTLSLTNSEIFKQRCKEADLDFYGVHMDLVREINRPGELYGNFSFRDFRDKEETLHSKAVKGCDFLSKKKKVNPLLVQVHHERDSRYGDTLDSYMFQDLSEQKIEFLGAGIYPYNGYVAKRDFDGFEKGKAYFWSNMIPVAKKILDKKGMTLAQAEKRGIVPALLGFNEDFHPSLPPSLIYLIYSIYSYAGKKEDFKLDDWRFSFYPCIIWHFS